MHNQSDVIAANVRLHTAAADRYKDEPHYRPESRARIREIIRSLQEETRGESLLDLGCGMGFIIDIAREFFKKIRGVDVTPAMLERVDVSSGQCDIKVQISEVERLPFGDNTFDVCTAHAVLHHLRDIAPAMREVCRVLRPGGIFYSDLDPNGYFWEAIKSLDPEGKFDSSIVREIAAVKNKDREMAETFDLDIDTVQKAEHWMHVQDGFREEELLSVAREAGFSHVEIRYHWFIGEAQVIHDERTRPSSELLRSYLQDKLPLTRHLFKYLGIVARK